MRDPHQAPPANVRGLPMLRPRRREGRGIGSFRARIAAIAAVSLAVLVLAVRTAQRFVNEMAVCVVQVDGASAPADPLCPEWLWGHVVVPAALFAACLGVLLVWCACAVSTAARQVRPAARFARELRAAEVATDPGVAGLADKLGVRACVVASAVPLAVTTGLLRPRILLADTLVERLTHGELRAVMHHEAHHARGHHPAAYALLRALAQAVSVLPVLEAWTERAVLVSEVEADRAAIEAAGRPAFLSALAKLSETEDPLTGRAVACGSARGMLPDRVRVLAGDRLPWPHTPRQLLLSLLGVLVLAAPAVGLLQAAARMQP